MSDRQFFVYIMTNPANTVLYIGVTNNLVRRVKEHKEKLDEGFTKKYNLIKLVYYESTDYGQSAVAREKELKGWKRFKKDNLINKNNPTWRDLYDDFSS